MLWQCRFIEINRPREAAYQEIVMAKIPRPQGHNSVTAGISVPDSAGIVKFLERTFGAKVVDRYDGPGGSLMHAEVLVEGSVVMLGDPMPGTEPMPAMLSVYVDDADAVDATYRRALDAGATSEAEPTVQPWGYRSACVRDAGGNRWTICTIVENVDHDEIVRRMTAAGF